MAARIRFCQNSPSFSFKLLHTPHLHETENFLHESLKNWLRIVPEGSSRVLKPFSSEWFHWNRPEANWILTHNLECTWTVLKLHSNDTRTPSLEALNLRTHLIPNNLIQRVINFKSAPLGFKEDHLHFHCGANLLSMTPLRSSGVWIAWWASLDALRPLKDFVLKNAAPWYLQNLKFRYCLWWYLVTDSKG